MQATLGKIIAFIMTGQLVLPGGTARQRSQAAEAHRLLEGRQTVGEAVPPSWTDTELKASAT